MLTRQRSAPALALAGDRAARRRPRFQLTGISVATSAALNAFWLSFAFELGAMFAMMLAYSNATTALAGQPSAAAAELPTATLEPAERPRGRPDTR